MKTANSLKVGVKSKSVAIRVATVFIVLSVAMLPGIVNHAQQLDVSQQALLYAAQINNLPLDRLVIANTAWLAKEIFRAKVLDKATGEIYVVSIHSSGKPATEEEVTELLRADVEKGFVGKVESSLKQRVDADPAGSSTVCIWVKTTEAPHERWRGLLAAGNREQAFAEAREFHARAEASVLQFLRARSIQVKHADEYVPVITVEIPNVMMQELEALPQVGRIFDDALVMPTLATSIPTIRAQKVWNAGFTGSGVKVAVVEVPYQGNSAVSGPNPYLIPASFYNPSFTTPGAHAVGVAGSFAARNQRTRA